MSEIIENSSEKKREYKCSPKVDMTPMVDLGFLLLTFFVLTTTFSKPQALELNMPLKGDPIKIREHRLITIILAENNIIYYYHGDFDIKAVPKIERTTFSKDGIRKILLQKNKSVLNKIKPLDNMLITEKMSKEQYNIHYCNALKDLNGAIVIIKAIDKAKVVNIVDALDEMAICSIGMYMLADVEKVEQNEISRQYPSEVFSYNK